jgi:uncharacterized membrane protein YecN with MAPEG domain
MTVLPITLTIAGAAALLNIWIASRVGVLRRGHGISIGDGGNDGLVARMRAHSNFTEYAPIFLILLALVELAQGSPTWLWITGAAFVAGRILHVFGMDRPPGNRLRNAGMVLTFLPFLGLALYAVAIPYLEGAKSPTITYAAPGPAASTLSATKGFVDLS